MITGPLERQAVNVNARQQIPAWHQRAGFMSTGEICVSATYAPDRLDGEGDADPLAESRCQLVMVLPATGASRVGFTPAGPPQPLSASDCQAGQAWRVDTGVSVQDRSWLTRAVPQTAPISALTRRHKSGLLNFALHSQEHDHHDRTRRSARLQLTGPKGLLHYRTADIGYTATLAAMADDDRVVRCPADGGAAVTLSPRAFGLRAHAKCLVERRVSWPPVAPGRVQAGGWTSAPDPAPSSGRLRLARSACVAGP